MGRTEIDHCDQDRKERWEKDRNDLADALKTGRQDSSRGPARSCATMPGNFRNLNSRAVCYRFYGGVYALKKKQARPPQPEEREKEKNKRPQPS